MQSCNVRLKKSSCSMLLPPSSLLSLKLWYFCTRLTHIAREKKYISVSPSHFFYFLCSSPQNTRGHWVKTAGQILNNFYSSSLTRWQNKLECLSLGKLFQASLIFSKKVKGIIFQKGTISFSSLALRLTSNLRLVTNAPAYFRRGVGDRGEKFRQPEWSQVNCSFFDSKWNVKSTLQAN